MAEDKDETGSGDNGETGAQLTGALIGWERRSSRHGMLITLQVVETAAQYQGHQFHRVTLALNDRQLRSLARDLARAARARGIELGSKPKLGKRVARRIKALVGLGRRK